MPDKENYVGKIGYKNKIMDTTNFAPEHENLTGFIYLKF